MKVYFVVILFIIPISFGFISARMYRRELSVRFGSPKGRDSKIIRSIEGEPLKDKVRRRRPMFYPELPQESQIVGNVKSKSKAVILQGKPSSRPDIIGVNALKILGGVCKGKRLESPPVYLRPMMAKVKEALFSTLCSLNALEGGGVLDVFAGSGSVGLEALSRGACYATFVDLSADCTATCLRNAATCGFRDVTTAVTAPAEEVLLHPARFGLHAPYALVSLTPPYEEVSYTALLAAACQSPLVRENTLLLVEYPAEMQRLPYVLGEDKFFGVRCRRYGRTVLAMYVFRPSVHFDLRPDEFTT